MASLSSFADEVNLLWSEIKGSCVKKLRNPLFIKKKALSLQPE